MPQELDERFGPTERQLNESSRPPPARHPVFRFRIVPAVLLGSVAAGLILIACLGSAQLIYHAATEFWWLWNYYFWEAMHLAVFAVTTLLTGITLLGSAICCWRARWRRFSALLVVAVLSGLIAAIFLPP